MNRWISPGNGPESSLRFHLWLYRTSDGRFGHNTIGAPALLLTTTGRKTGQRRTTPLVYVRDGGRAVVGATSGGKGRPGWYYNLTSDPRAEIQIGRQHLAVSAARVAPDDPLYAALWQRLDAVTHGRFSAYEARLGEAIPLVALELAG